jgi:hypothetical protein
MAKYKLDIVGVHEVRWEIGGMLRERNCNLFVQKEKKTINWKQNCLYIAK